jgi:hypothetical protein
VCTAPLMPDTAAGECDSSVVSAVSSTAGG